MTALTVLREKWLGRIGRQLPVRTEDAIRLTGHRDNEYRGSEKIAQQAHDFNRIDSDAKEVGVSVGKI
jgi:hypothetical protein